MFDRFYLPDSLHQPDFVLGGAEARHLSRVLRKRTGEDVTLFDGRGNEVRARIVAMDRRSVRLSPQAPPSHRAATGASIVLATAVPKGDRARWLVEKATELGAAAWIPLISEHSVVRPGDTKLEKLEQTVIAACKQCGRNDLMPIHEPRTWVELLDAADSDATLFVADPSGPPPAEWLRGRHDTAPVAATIAIGPEGGFTDAELAAARACGARLVGLGEYILRIETAAVALLSAIRMHTSHV